MEDEYVRFAKEVKEELHKDISNIYNNYNYELILKLADINLLEDIDSSIRSSTAIGYCIEEFLIKKLISINSKKYLRVENSKTINTSADLLIYHPKYKIMVNFKANKNTSANNAISALGCIYNDYVKTNPSQQKLYLVFVSYYRILKDRISVDNFKSYYLGQVYFEFLTGDKRNWSEKYNPDSGRIQYNFKKYGRKEILKIDYKATCKNLEDYRIKIHREYKNKKAKII